MKLIRASASFLGVLLVTFLIFSTTGVDRLADGEKKALADGPEAAKAGAECARRAELEKKFQESMNQATLVGKWRLVTGDQLGEERGEKYTLGAVRKVDGDAWVIEARIEYGDKNVAIPVPVKVYWAGDTPVISVTDLWLPGLGKYTARVLVYNDYYAGSWFAPDHGGLMNGKIVRAKEGAGAEK